MAKDSIEIRKPKASDLNFIQATFLKSMKRESPLGRSCSSQVFHAQFPYVIDYILSTSEVLVACDRDEEDVIIGYLIFDPSLGTIHYAYTKAAARKLDVARELVEHAFPGIKYVYFSLTTNAAKKIAEKYPELIHNPFSLFKRGA